MFYSLFFNFSFNVRINRNYTNIENEKKRRCVEIINVFIDENNNFFNNNFNLLYNLNFFNSNFDLFYKIMLTRDRVLQNITFTTNNCFSSSKLNNKHRVTKTKNNSLNKFFDTSILVSCFEINISKLKFTKFTKLKKRDKFENSKIKVFTRVRSRVNRYVFLSFLFFVI